MRVIQMLTTVLYGDAVGNDVMAIDETLKRAGYETGIFAENIGARISHNRVKHISEIPLLDENDVIIYHLAVGTKLNYQLHNYGGKKIIVYHNITPRSFFAGYSHSSWWACNQGKRGVEYLSDKADYCLADSGYNKTDLEAIGYNCKIDVLPILIPFNDYRKEPNQDIIKRYENDGFVNILFTGRIAPNKCHEDIIAAFAAYKKYYNRQSRLILVGNYTGMEHYYNKLQKYSELLGVMNDVVFTGHIKFDEILAYYHISDLFVCMSEHEGFCVPLVEAMFFDLPIIAYDSTAIPDTLGGSGILLKDKNPLETAGVINQVILDKNLQNRVICGQRERLKDFEHEVIEKQLLSYLERFSRNN